MRLRSKLTRRTKFKKLKSKMQRKMPPRRPRRKLKATRLSLPTTNLLLKQEMPPQLSQLKLLMKKPTLNQQEMITQLSQLNLPIKKPLLNQMLIMHLLNKAHQKPKLLLLQQPKRFSVRWISLILMIGLLEFEKSSPIHNNYPYYLSKNLLKIQKTIIFIWII